MYPPSLYYYCLNDNVSSSNYLMCSSMDDNMVRIRSTLHVKLHVPAGSHYTKTDALNMYQFSRLEALCGAR